MFGTSASLNPSGESDVAPFTVSIHEELGVMIPLEEAVTVVAGLAHTVGSNINDLVATAPTKEVAHGAHTVNTAWVTSFTKLCRSMVAAEGEARLALDDIPDVD